MEELEKRFLDSYYDSNNNGLSITTVLPRVYYKTFGLMAKRADVMRKFGEKQTVLSRKNFLNGEMKGLINEYSQDSGDLGFRKFSYKKLMEQLENSILVELEESRLDSIILLKTGCILKINNHYSNRVTIYYNSDAALDILAANIDVSWEGEDDEMDNRTYGYYTYLTYGLKSYNERYLRFEAGNINLKKNYNNDLPYDKLTNFIKRDKEGLAILYGEPGTGKTSIMKKMILDNPETKFIIFSNAFLGQITSDTFLNYLMKNRNENVVYILEDCEKAIMKRERGGDASSVVALLNTTDGILGSSLKTKFLCTFNTGLDNIDKALLRKGRLYLMYEFKKLELEKAKEIDETATEPDTLANLYNREENNLLVKAGKKIGF